MAARSRRWTVSPINLMLTGAIALASLLVGLFFFRFWRQTRDRFFLYFALAFWIEAADRVAIGWLTGVQEDHLIPYTVRVIGSGLILVAVWQKNRRS